MSEKDTKVKGVEIRYLNYAMMVVSFLILILLVYNTLKMPEKYHELVNTTERYRVCEKSSNELSEASDYLTEQVRLYVINMDTHNMENYFNEVNVEKNREKAIEELKRNGTSEASQKSLESALQASNELMEREIYAMKLISVANNYDESLIPQEVRRYQLKASDLELTSEEQIEKAVQLVFDKGYQDSKALIDSYLDRFTSGVLEQVSLRDAASEKALANYLAAQRVLIFAMFAMNIFTFVAIITLIVRPLTLHIKRIKENNMLEIVGSYELKYLALTYNDIYELNEANKLDLESKATHDPLTKLLNRGAFDNVRTVLKNSTAPLAFIILDVDNFKTVNDRYGHEIGDRLLQKVAYILQSIFRSSDYIIRLGGDEFAVIVPDMKDGDKPVLESKFNMLNYMIADSSDGVPRASLSIGVAFSDSGFPEELYSMADDALYEIKENGKKGYKIHE